MQGISHDAAVKVSQCATKVRDLKVQVQDRNQHVAALQDEIHASKSLLTRCATETREHQLNISRLLHALDHLNRANTKLIQSNRLQEQTLRQEQQHLNMDLQQRDALVNHVEKRMEELMPLEREKLLLGVQWMNLNKEGKSLVVQSAAVKKVQGGVAAQLHRVRV